MSTRSVIARKTKTGFEGTYHHWDGYPSGVGATLFKIRKGVFSCSTKEMLKTIIDDHPGGWSTICRDWNNPIETMDDGFSDTDAPEAYGPDRANSSLVTEKTASECGCEYAYVFPKDGKTMEIWSSFCDPNSGKSYAGKKMIGAFGCGDPKAEWRCMVSVALDGEEPNWELMDELACGEKDN